MPDFRVVTREMLADMETPVSAYLKLCHNRPDSALLESAEPHESIGRYSIIAFDPLTVLELWPDNVRRAEAGVWSTHPTQAFFDQVRQIVKTHVIHPDPDLQAVGSLMGFIGYNAVRLVERLGDIPPSDLPVARLFYPSRYVVFDHRKRTMTLVAIATDENEGSRKLADTADRLKSGFTTNGRRNGIEIQAPPRDHYQEAVRQAKEYIRDGEIFQVVLADRFEGRVGVEPFDVYRRLRVKSPSPYMFYLNYGVFQVLGASPETLVKVDRDRVTVRPIAGTRGRSDDPDKDLALERELMASEKERAEHVMLVDLGRNDVGRVSRYGSVTVAPYMSVERYSHVMHIVSQVQGALRPEMDAVDAFMAGFPAGTVSGAPKVRAMQIIDELERLPRYVYSGAVGHFGPGARMDTCIAIRMMLFHEDRFSIPVGAGIVADSNPKEEYREIQNKAAQSIAALEAASKGEL